MGVRWASILPVLLAVAGCAVSPSVQAEGPKDLSSQFINREAIVRNQNEFSLSTYEWDYAPWMREFESRLYEKWEAPEASLTGENSGIVFLKVIVEKNGAFSEIEVKNNTGRESLAVASVASVRKISELLPLPEHFVDENLELHLKLQYPGFRK